MQSRAILQAWLGVPFFMSRPWVATTLTLLVTGTMRALARDSAGVAVRFIY